jgi:hypothetical protein
MSIAVTTGGDVYVAGSSYEGSIDEQNLILVPGYWINGIWVGLPLPTSSPAGNVRVILVQ